MLLATACGLQDWARLFMAYDTDRSGELELQVSYESPDRNTPKFTVPISLHLAPAI